MKNNNQKKLLSFSVGKKSVIWISTTNKYVVAEPLAAEILEAIQNGNPINQIVADCAVRYEISEEVARPLVMELAEQWKVLGLPEPASRKNSEKSIRQKEIVPFSVKYYQINGVIFFVEYETLFAEQINHPKFGHLEVEASENFDHRFQVFDDGTEFSLWVNNKFIGKWKRTEGHFASGKFSMQVIEKIYGKDESQWIGVFHAAGISNGKNCAMFFGESGSGKSTLSALLMAAGFDVLSDDFLPVENESAQVFRFPAALSIKKKAYDLVTSLFPDLKNAEEHKNPELKKTFRYLAPENRTLDGVPCKALVMVKYDSSVDFQMVKLEADEALTHLIPDSWIHPSEANARKFVQWFTGLEHYRLTYSNNEKMVSAVNELLKE